MTREMRFARRGGNDGSVTRSFTVRWGSAVMRQTRAEEEACSECGRVLCVRK